ncbi:mannan-binding lectin [Arenicella xantha]|uniref:Mannan-binding protein n=1 Tax=Arenicella xantha TaxID=644221 RepID=A0A395JME3_9GAMM|nr:mannan-binding lectin [Arenicella xantha]RBP51017.1 mannan-binding protein [Arenicella xantha]
MRKIILAKMNVRGKRARLWLAKQIAVCLVTSFVIAQSAYSPTLWAAEPSAVAASLSNADQVKNCDFSQAANWWQRSVTQVPGSIASNPVTGSPEFCEFYQFAQDWFLYLISPSAKPGLANWQDQAQYPVLEIGANSCDGATKDRGLSIRTAKTIDDTGAIILPERTDQAGAHAIYDQAGNVVFYEIRLSHNLCDYAAIQSEPNFPAKTVEMKMAWRVMKPNESTDGFVLSDATIDGVDYTLGMIGWHIVVAADNHPEMVWITLDHQANAVDCADMAKGQSAYDFTSEACAVDATACQKLNESQPFTTVSLPSGQRGNDICQEFPYGTVEGDPIDTRNGLNIALIEKLNAAQQTVLAGAGVPASLDVWKSYEFNGALWVSDISKGSGSSSPASTTNQRGSLELANVVLETTFQGSAANGGGALNCFGCHNYNGTANVANQPNTSFAAHLSHSFDDMILGQCKDVASATLINNQAQADAACPTACAPQAGFSKWNGQWTNKGVPMTVCGCCPDSVK